jgi:hypothetical protein
MVVGAQRKPRVPTLSRPPDPHRWRACGVRRGVVRSAHQRLLKHQDDGLLSSSAPCTIRVGVGRWLLGAAVLAACGCDVPPAPQSTGPVDVTAGPCGRGVVVSSSGNDFASTNISLTNLQGEPLSESFLSSGSAPAGISAALSGDVVLPLQTPPSGHVVLIDRQNATITWADPLRATVAGQMSVATGFASNPHDYCEVAGNRAYVSRYQTNPSPGRQPMDEGGDLLIVDLRERRASGRVALPSDANRQPFPDRIVLSGSVAIVALHLFEPGYRNAGNAKLVGVSTDTDAIIWTVELRGLSNCSALAVAPSGSRLAIGCSGGMQDLPEVALQHSGVVLMDLTQQPPAQLGSYPASAALKQVLGPSVGFLSETLLITRTYGDANSGAGDQIVVLDTVSGEVRIIEQTHAPFMLGDVRCGAPCGSPCLVADAELGGLRRFRVTTGPWPESMGEVKVDTLTGMPPRYLGGF